MKHFPILFLVVLITACSGGEEAPKKKYNPEESAAQFQGVETLFDKDSFEDSKHVELLKELKICSEFQKDTSNYLEPACSPRFFRILSMRDDMPVENAFLLQIKSKVGGIKLRRLVTFVRERGELVKVNTFVANLIGTRRSKSHYNDLILRFNDNIDGEIVFYNCIFSWDGTRYKFQSVELIEGATWRQRLKPEFKDSVSNDIYQTLLKNEMIM
ncbi:MAG: hypothetical protein ACK457_02560 [Flavobacteriia bacterium]